MGSNSEENVKSEHILDDRVSGDLFDAPYGPFSNILVRHLCGLFGL